MAGRTPHGKGRCSAASAERGCGRLRRDAECEVLGKWRGSGCLAPSPVNLTARACAQAAYMSKLGLSSGRIGAGTVLGIIVAAVAIALVAGYAVHRLRMRRVMQSEIRDIMCARFALRFGTPSQTPAGPYLINNNYLRSMIIIFQCPCRVILPASKPCVSMHVCTGVDTAHMGAVLL